MGAYRGFLDGELVTQRRNRICPVDNDLLLQASCITAPMSVLLSLAASNVKGNTKRSVVNTMFFIGYCAGCIGSPQLWTKAPKYTEGVITSVVTWCLLFTAVIIYLILCTVDNNSRNKQGAAENIATGDIELDENGLPKTDYTDKEDRDFRYSL